MTAAHTATPMENWGVTVEGIGYIGDVQETTEANARCAALCKYAEEGDRPAGDDRLVIFEDDEISVCKR